MFARFSHEAIPHRWPSNAPHAHVGVVYAIAPRRAGALLHTNRMLTVHNVTMDFPKAFEMAPNLWLGLAGLATDVMTVRQKMEFRKQMYELTENRKMKTQVRSFIMKRP